MLRFFMGLVLVMGLFAENKATAQCQQGQSTQSNQQVQLLTQQLQQLQNQILQQQQASALTSTARPATAQVAQARPVSASKPLPIGLPTRSAQVAQPTRMTKSEVEAVLASRGYSKNPNTGRWSAGPAIRNPLTTAELTSLGVRQVTRAQTAVASNR